MYKDDNTNKILSQCEIAPTVQLINVSPRQNRIYLVDGRYSVMWYGSPGELKTHACSCDDSPNCQHIAAADAHFMTNGTPPELIEDNVVGKSNSWDGYLDDCEVAF